jgi:hypothetical protein
MGPGLRRDDEARSHRMNCYRFNFQTAKSQGDFATVIASEAKQSMSQQNLFCKEDSTADLRPDG